MSEAFLVGLSGSSFLVPWVFRAVRFDSNETNKTGILKPDGDFQWGIFNDGKAFYANRSKRRMNHSNPKSATMAIITFCRKSR